MSDMDRGVVLYDNNVAALLFNAVDKWNKRL